MSKLSDFTDEFLLSSYPNIVVTEEIQIIDDDDFTCLSFATEDHVEAELSPVSPRKSSRETYFFTKSMKSRSDVRYGNPPLRRATVASFETIPEDFKSQPTLKRVTGCVEDLSKPSKSKSQRHFKFFDRISEIFLGESKIEAARNSAKLGVEEFVKGNLTEARRYFNNAFKNSDDKEYHENLLKITQIVIEAEGDIEREKFVNCVINMQNAYIGCMNDEMKKIVGDKRNIQAAKFYELGDTYKNDGNLNVAEEYLKLAYKICTPESNLKEEYGNKLGLN